MQRIDEGRMSKMDFVEVVGWVEGGVCGRRINGGRKSQELLRSPALSESRDRCAQIAGERPGTLWQCNKSCEVVLCDKINSNKCSLGLQCRGGMLS